MNTISRPTKTEKNLKKIYNTGYIDGSYNTFTPEQKKLSTFIFNVVKRPAPTADWKRNCSLKAPSYSNKEISYALDSQIREKSTVSNEYKKDHIDQAFSTSSSYYSSMKSVKSSAALKSGYHSFLHNVKVKSHDVDTNAYTTLDQEKGERHITPSTAKSKGFVIYVTSSLCSTKKFASNSSSTVEDAIKLAKANPNDVYGTTSFLYIAEAIILGLGVHLPLEACKAAVHAGIALFHLLKNEYDEHIENTEFGQYLKNGYDDFKAHIKACINNHPHFSYLIHHVEKWMSDAEKIVRIIAKPVEDIVNIVTGDYLTVITPLCANILVGAFKDLESKL